MNDVSRRESALIHVIESVCSEYEDLLLQRGLCMQSPEILVLDPSIRNYSSESRVDIVDAHGGQLVDCLEFFAYQNGHPQVSPNDLHAWLIQQIPTLGH